MRTGLPLLLFAALFFTFSSCVKEGADIKYNYYGEEEYKEMSKTLNLPESPLEYVNDFPSYYTGFSAPFDKDLATLGRVIFYDKALSSDGTISCASCHDQKAGFADPKAFSDGVEGRSTSRNSLALGSVFSFQEYYGSMSFGRVPFFWDNRAASVEEQSKQTFANEREMDMQMHEVVNAVNNQNYYRPLLKAATGSEIANENSVLQAVSVFVNSISSFSSKYDDALSEYFNEKGSLVNIETVNLPLLSPIENQGKNIYMNDCASCHGQTNGFPGIVMGNNGLDMNYEDDGMGELNSNPYEDGVFKVPTLRNITLTQPYMHDGRFATIDAVIEHYSTGIQNHANLSPELKNGSTAKKFNYTSEEKAALKAFFETFVDPDIASEEKYADPFIL